MSAATVQNQLQSAIARHQQGDIAGAAAGYAAVLQQNPQVADAWHLSGLVAWHNGAYADAENLIHRALELQPQQPEYLSNLAAVLLAADRPKDAEQAARQAIQRGFKGNKCRKHLATAVSRQGRYGEGIHILQQLIQENPLDATAHSNLGAMLQEAKRYDEAVAVLDIATELEPGSYQARLNLGAALRETNQLQRSLRELNEAVRLGPRAPQCYINRGNTRLDLGDASLALEDFQHAIELDPRSAVAMNGLGRALQTMGQWATALESLELACQLDGPGSRFDSNRLYCASLTPELSSQQLFEMHAAWGRETETRFEVLPPVRYHHDRIRIGYVSPDFRNHATMRFILPQLEGHSEQVDIYCYAEGRFDDVTDRVRNCCAGWRPTSHLSDEDLAAQIRRDEIDVLIDLAGHTAGNRMPVFAMRPATAHVSFLGYPNTTGLSRIDFFLTDSVREPEPSESQFTEERYRLPHGACCFEAPSDLAISEPPSINCGDTTFGSTHRLEKLSSDCLKVWARILNSVPDSRLLVIRDTLASEETRQQLAAQLQSAGVDTAQVEFRWTLPADHLQIYSDIDILLDVFPWGSGTTAYECMWMGVPIPTIIGDRGGCRATASMMQQLGLEELSASTLDQYVQLTTSLAADRTRLQHLRHHIRPVMQQTVCNGKRFAGDIETACAKMLQTVVSQNPQLQVNAVREAG